MDRAPVVLSALLVLGLVALTAFPYAGEKFYIQFTTKIMILAIFAISLDLLVGAPEGGLEPAGAGIVRLFSGNAWLEQGAPLFGSAGTPLIWATGQAQEGKAVSLGLSNGLAAAPCVLLIGLQPLLADFKGGTLVPDPQWASPPLVTDALGEVQMDGTWPPGAPPGTALYFQWWITDPGAIEGWAATAGLKVIVH